MRKTTVRAMSILVLVAGLAAWALPAAAGEEATSTFRVQGMTCGGCEVAVKTKVKKLDGIVSVEASHEEGRAVVVHDPEKVSAADIEEAIESLGYEAELIEPEEGEDEGGEDAPSR